MAFMGLPCPKKRAGNLSVAVSSVDNLRNELAGLAMPDKGNVAIILIKSFLRI
ncbi:hypothetical protein D3C72_2289460 [compost metagenome]